MSVSVTQSIPDVTAADVDASALSAGMQAEVCAAGATHTRLPLCRKPPGTHAHAAAPCLLASSRRRCDSAQRSERAVAPARPSQVDANFAAATGVSGAATVTATVTDAVAAAGRRLTQAQQGAGVVVLYVIVFTLPAGQQVAGVAALAEAAANTAATDTTALKTLLQVRMMRC
jgi:hypothetical protein